MNKETFSEIRPENETHFCDLMQRHLMLELRKEIGLFILRNNQDDYFILDTFYRKHLVYGNNELTLKLTNTLVEELHALGWKTKIVHGGTSIYIFTKQPHKSDNFEDIID